MATNPAVDELIEKAQRLGCHKTKRAAVTAALSEYISHRERLKLLALFGTLDFDRRYDHKAGRRRKR
jgi:hypothetical protein